jgi:hypothetical protein
MIQKHNKTLHFCITLSVLLHVGFLSYLHNHAFPKKHFKYQMFNDSSKKQLSLNSQKQQLEILFSSGKKNEKEIAITPSVTDSSMEMQNKQMQLKSLENAKMDLFPDDGFLTADLDSDLIAFSPFNFKNAKKIKSFAQKNLIDSLKKELSKKGNEKELSPPEANLENTKDVKTEKKPQLRNPSSQIANLSIDKIDVSNFDIANNEFPNNSSIKKVKPNVSTTFLPFPTLKDLKTISCGNDFDVDVVYAPKQENDGYVFAITLIPKGKNVFKRIKQNFYFLIDRSNSIQGSRLTKTRHALMAALTKIDPQDTFNIISFDSNIDFFYHKTVPPTHTMISHAKNFLLNQRLGSFFNNPNYYDPLLSVLETPLKDDENNIIILLTNGDSLSKYQNYKVIDYWTQNNQGKVSLFAVSLSKDKNTPLLDTLCSLNRGKLSVSSSLNGIKRRLIKLMQSINYPIAKNICPSVICDNSDVKIKLYPKQEENMHLYIQEPYVILGTTNKLEDFTLFLQGRHADNYFNIKKDISFSNADKGEKPLHRQWATQLAFLCYKKYLKTANPAYLKKAKQILEPYSVKVAFKK